MNKPHKLITPEKKPELELDHRPLKERCEKSFCSHRYDTSKKGFCSKYDMLIKDVTFCVKLFKGGWLSPQGEFIESDFGSHDVDSEEILEKREPIVFQRLKNKYWKKHKEGVFLNEYTKDKLVEKGWVDLTGNPYPMMGFTQHTWAVCIAEEKVTPQQHAVIQDYIKKGMRFAGFVTINRRVVKEE